MNKAFEKIFERLEGTKDIEHDDSVAEVVSTRIWNKAIHRAKQIVKEVAKEYNGCWIPCSERLPEEHKLYDITFKNSAGIHSDSAIYNPYLKRWLWDADETELVENEILAWAEKREPYQPKGE